MPNTLPPDVFEAIVNALAAALVNDYRARWGTQPRTESVPSSVPAATSAWLTVRDAAQRSQCSTGTLLREARKGRLRAVRVGGRRTYRFRPDWVDAWLEGRDLPQPPDVGRASKSGRNR
jgi:excisionase family DNA binding protein